jgi:hypothetical protein
VHLTFRKPMPRKWRQEFIRILLAHGIAPEATPRPVSRKTSPSRLKGLYRPVRGGLCALSTPKIAFMSPQVFTLLRLHVVADADPGVLARVLERFQNLVLPRRVNAELGTTGMFDIQVDFADLPEDTLALVAAKLGQVPTIVSADWHRL